jgi:hypothetical protein
MKRVNEDVIQSQFEPERRVRSALVCGAGGFIGSHLVKRLKREGLLGTRGRLEGSAAE